MTERPAPATKAERRAAWRARQPQRPARASGAQLLEMHHGQLRARRRAGIESARYQRRAMTQARIGARQSGRRIGRYVATEGRKRGLLP